MARIHRGARRLPRRPSSTCASRRVAGTAGRWRRCASASAAGRRSCSRRTAPTSTRPGASTRPSGAGWCSSATARAAVRPRAKDLARFATHEERRIRRDILEHLRQVAKAPTGSEVIVVPPESRRTGSVERFRVVDDPEAPGARPHRLRRHPPLPAEGAGRGPQPAGRAADRHRLRDPVRAPGPPHRRARRVLPPTEVRIAAVQRVLRDAGCSSQYERDPQFFEKAKAADRGGSAATG